MTAGQGFAGASNDLWIEPRRFRLYLSRYSHATERLMTTFDNREQAFENRFAHEADLQFKVAARRDKLLGLWAAEKLGKAGADAEAYAASVVIADLQEAGFEDVVRKLVADLSGAGVDEAAIRAMLAEKTDEARRQIAETL